MSEEIMAVCLMILLLIGVIYFAVTNKQRRANFEEKKKE